MACVIKQNQTPPLSVIAPGSPVKLAGGVDATVGAVRVDPGPSILYLVAWWNGYSRCEQWVYPHEVFTNDEPKLRIGFGNRP